LLLLLSADIAQAQVATCAGQTAGCRIDDALFGNSPATAPIGNDTAGGLTIGYSGNGVLGIQGGAAVISGFAFNGIGNTIGDLATGVGTVTVSGLNSAWTQSGNALIVGNAGAGTLNIQNGGQVVSAAGGIVGNGASGSGAVTVTGPGSFWRTNTASISVGSAGRGTLAVADGASVTTSSLDIGGGAGGSGAVSVNGSGSVLQTTAMRVGTAGAGSLAIESGGTVNNNGNVFVGNSATGSGAVTLTGAQSNWNISADLYVGLFGSGALTVADGASANPSSLFVAARAGSRGTVNIGAAADATAAAPGTLGAPSVEFGPGSGLLVFNHTASAYTFAPAINGPGAVNVLSGTTIFATDKAYTGGTTISAGTLQLGNGGASGSVVGNITDNGALAFNRNDAQTFAGIISGTGTLTQAGTGTTVLTGTNSYAGATTVAAGGLYVDGNQAGATGPTIVAAGATLGGSGTIGGNVTVGDGATLSPGSLSNAPGTLTINGNLSLSGSSLLAYSLGEANAVGGAFNDLATVGGDLVLDGVLNVVTAPGGAFDTGIYRLISYAGGLTNNGLSIGSIPSPDYFVQTSVANQVNLINTSGLTLNYWDGAAGPKNNGVVNGGNGIWQTSAGNDNWTEATGTPNAPFTDRAFAVFTGLPGSVSVDNSLGPVTASGMQFAVGGYVVGGNLLTLVDATSAPGISVIRVGDGTAASAGYTATINAVLTGSSELVKVDGGTLVLTASNTYSGGTLIEDGTLQLGDGGTSGGIMGDVTNNGLLAFNRSNTVEFARAISGTGGVDQIGTGTILLSSTANTYSGATRVAAGVLQAGTASTFSPNSAVTVAASAALNLNGFSQIVAGLSNAGRVTWGAGALPGTALTTRDYAGLGGTLEINTFLGGDGSPSDRLVIDGGAASGRSIIVPHNAGGLGELTTGNGILVVDAANGGITSGTAFVLTTPVLAGPYEYRLRRGSADGSSTESWYLSSTLDCGTAGAPSPPCPSPPAPPVPPPAYRPEVSLVAALPTVAAIYARAVVDTLHERVGDEHLPGQRGQNASEDGGFGGAWVRALHHDGKRDGGDQGIYGDKGPGFDFAFDVLQLGVDLYRSINQDGGHQHAGSYLAYGKARGRVQHNWLDYDFHAGTDEFDARTLAAYWTAFSPRGAYVDSVVQYTWYDMRARSTRLPDTFTNGTDVLASVEAGWPWRLGEDRSGDWSEAGWRIEPQAQVIWQKTSLDDLVDSAARVRYSDGDASVGRLGVRLNRVGLRAGASGDLATSWWIRGDAWHQFSGSPNTEFSSESGYVPFTADLGDSWGEVGLGGTWQVTASGYLFADADYTWSFDGGETSWNGKLGMRWQW